MVPQNMDVEKSSSKDEILMNGFNENSSQGEENISSHEATSNNNQDLSPSISNTAVAERSHDGNPDDEPDETLAERLWGLTEMFPGPVVDYASKISKATKNGLSVLYSFSCKTAWVVITSGVILLAPPIFEIERANLKELQMSQEKQVLLGPSAVLGTKSAKVTK